MPSGLRKGLAALIVEGGAMRGVFAVGVLRSFADEGFFPFDFCVAVSAGAFAYALARMGRVEVAHETFTQLASKKSFVSLPRFVGGGHLLDIDGLAAQVEPELRAGGPLVWPAPFHIVVTHLETGQPRYPEARRDNLVDLLRATVSMPWLYRGFPLVDGWPATDGGASDAIPIRYALDRGATRIVVIRSRPRSYVKFDTLAHKLVRWNVRKYPALCTTMRGRAARFQESIELIRRPPEGVQVLEICTPESFAMGLFGQNRSSLEQGYAAGLREGARAIRAWSAFPSSSVGPAPVSVGEAGAEDRGRRIKRNSMSPL